MEKFTPHDVVDLLKSKIKPNNFKSKHDALFILLHSIMESAGFKLVGLGESENLVENKAVPDDWNASQDAWAFRYRHNKSSMIFLLKALRLGTQLHVHALAVEQDQPLSLELNVPDYVVNDNFSDVENLYRNVENLVEIFAKNVMSKLLPSVQDVSAPAPTAPTRSSPASRPPDPYYPPDPLRIGPPRTPQYPQGLPPFGTGGEDLYHGPGGGFGFIPGGDPYGGVPFGGGGSLIGPHHPGFGIRDPSRPPLPNGGRGFPFPPPPGARFDPYGPPGVRPNPDPDHLPPPGHNYDDYFT